MQVSKSTTVFGPLFRKSNTYSKQFCTKANQGVKKFDTTLLDVIVCPLTKTPLRYDEGKYELICDELGTLSQ
jgi:hypothetical protein